jgi:hypothetical protein
MDKIALASWGSCWEAGQDAKPWEYYYSVGGRCQRRQEKSGIYVVVDIGDNLIVTAQRWLHNAYVCLDGLGWTLECVGVSRVKDGCIHIHFHMLRSCWGR